MDIGPEDIGTVDPADDDLMAALGEVRVRSRAHGRPGSPTMSARAWVAQARHPDSGERLDLLAAHDGGRPVGIAMIWSSLLDNVDKSFLELDVDPDARGRGVGSALLAATEQVVVDLGRTMLLAEVKTPLDRVRDHPDRRFAEQRGYAFSNVEVNREQTLPVPQGTLDGWAARAAARAAPYDLQTHAGDFPDDLAPSLCLLLGQLAVDAPTGAVDFEEEVYTPQRLAERYATTAAMGQEILETVAVTADGVVAAQSTLAVSPAEAHAWQWGTFVHREHRGHRLGLAVKTANLAALQERHPHVRRVLTRNAETNASMVAINEEMGYRVVEATVELVRRL